MSRPADLKSYYSLYGICIDRAAEVVYTKWRFPSPPPATYVPHPRSISFVGFLKIVCLKISSWSSKSDFQNKCFT